MIKTWQIKEFADAVSGKIIKDSGKNISGFSIDSRKITPDCMYIAIKGENHNGHKFCESAAEAGAGALLVSELSFDCEKGDVSVILVEDTVTALQKAANYYRNSLKNTVFIGVTGSNGKTTTRSMIYHLLSDDSLCSMTKGNFNNHIGLPLTLLETNPKSDYAIIEMGMNHRSEITELCKIANPDAAVISNVGPAHIGILGTLENIARAKSEIIEGLNAIGSIAVFPSDTEFTHIFEQAGKKCKLVSFGESNSSEFKITDIISSADNTKFCVSWKTDKYECLLNVPGRHNAFNAVAALALCSSLAPHKIEKFIKRLESYAPVSARMEKIIKDGVTIILDCYNANPASMKEALRYLSDCDSNLKIAVIGDMRELGEVSEEYHRILGKQAFDASLDYLICLGDDVKYTVAEALNNGMPANRAIKLNSETETAELLRGKLQKGSTVLFKASRGMHFENIVQKIWPDLGKNLH